MAAKALTVRERQPYIYTAGISSIGNDLADMVDGNRRGIGFIDKTVTTAQMLALNATPVELIAAPGAGKSIVLHGILAKLEFNSAAYVKDGAGDLLRFQFTDGPSTIVNDASDEVTAAFITATADAYRMHWFATGVGGFDLKDNSAVEVQNIASGELITGDSPVKFRLMYSVALLDFT